MGRKYHKAALGGTFDRLHKGHEHLLTTALDTADELLVGITTEILTGDKPLAQLIEPYEVRELTVRKLLDSKGAANRYAIVPLNDVYGTTLTDTSIDVIVVTEQTLPGAGVINAKRQELGQIALPVVVAGLIKDAGGTYLSSTRIRQGLVSRSGRVYLDVFSKDYQVTPGQKKLMAKPLGDLVPNVEAIPPLLLKTAPAIGLVGDVVAKSFKDNNMPFTYAVVDGHTKREQITHKLGITNLSAQNPAGIITQEAVTAVRHLTSLPSGVLFIEGEEDLVGFPLALALPLKSILVYGQPDAGVVYQVLTEEKKGELADMFDIRIDT